MKTFGGRLERAWKLRMNARFDDCRRDAGRLARDLGCPLANLDGKSPESDDAVDLSLLFASLARAEGDRDLSRRLVDWVESGLRARGAAPPFQLHFQKGMNWHVEGEHAKALECYLAARAAASDDGRRSFALTNALICLESLGLPLERTHTELRRLGAKASEGVRAQLAAFELRHAFRAGRIAHVLRAGAHDAESMTQADYYRLWVAELPFHRHHRPTLDDCESLALTHPFFHQKSYRLRTLQGVLHPEDLGTCKATELSDRFYLWTWRWLVDPRRYPVERVLALLRDRDFPRLAPQLTAEDGQLIRNALTWLALFDPAAATPVARLTEAISQPTVEDFPLYSLEQGVVTYLRALRDREAADERAAWERLTRHPLWDRADLRLPAMLHRLRGRDADCGSLAPLEAQLRRLLDRASRDVAAPLIVHLPDYRIEWARGKKTMVSEPICLALEILAKEKTVSCDELLRVCFGISKYDPIIHNAKIFNLLARLRRLVPSALVFRMRDGRVYAAGPWDAVVFRRQASLTAYLRERPEWRALTEQARKGRAATATATRDHWVRPAFALKQLAGQKQLRREDLEAVTGKSKSTVNRLILDWLRKGILKKTGTARNTRYTLTAPLEGTA